ncbi:MAG: hypothetical protein H7174_04170 [Flavobacterium sp.]|nr:hypothetical protein [Flavobacterium sp.]
MKKLAFIFMIIVSIVLFSSFAWHKFYVSIYQINYNQKKQMLEITSRIFIDDLNDILKLKYNRKTHLTEKEETVDDLNLMQKYLLENFSVTINEKSQTINYINRETESNVIICYYSIKNVSKIRTISIKNTVLFGLNDEQQNIIQTKIYDKKENLLLTPNTFSGVLNF